MGTSAVAVSRAANVSVPCVVLSGKYFQATVVCFNMDYIPFVDVVVESLTREHYRQQFLLDLRIVLFGVCHGSACVAYRLAILHERSSQARLRRVCLNRYSFSHVVVTQHWGVTELHVYRTHAFCVIFCNCVSILATEL